MSGVLKKIDNFWYHHKFKVLVALFFLITLTVCLVQCFTREEPDVTICYCGPRTIYVNNDSSIRDSIKSIMDDYNEDGTIGLTLLDLVYLTEEQQEEALRNDSEILIVPSHYIESQKRLNNELMVGESMLFMLDPAVFEMFNMDDRFSKLSDLLGYLPEEAINEYGIELGKTEFYKNSSALRYLPEDTVLCIRNLGWVNGILQQEEKHESAIKLFKAILEYQGNE